MNSIWDIINVPAGWVLRFCNTIVQNQYVFALFLFAIVIEIILLPFGVKQQKNSIRQARLRPKELAIRKKYAGSNSKQSQQHMTQEIQEMYQKENYSPLSGCLPLLIQLPIMIALYNIVMNPLKYICGLSEDAISQILTIVKTFPQYADSLKSVTASRTIELLGAVKTIMTENGAEVFEAVEGFSTKVPSVDALPNLTLFGAVNLAEIPSFVPLTWLTLIPVLTFLVYFLSMKITRKFSFQANLAANDQAQGCSNNMMDITMPLMSVFITFQVPAAIGVYWIFKSIIGTVKTFLLHKAMPLPVFTKEELDEAEREIGLRGKGKSRAKSEGESNVDGDSKTPFDGRADQSSAPKKQGRPGSVRSLHYIDDEDFEDTRERAERAKAVQAEIEAEKKAVEDQRAKKLAARATHPEAPVLKDDAKPEAKAKETGDFGPEGKVSKEATEENTPTENH